MLKTKKVDDEQKLRMAQQAYAPAASAATSSSGSQSASTSSSGSNSLNADRWKQWYLNTTGKEYDGSAFVKTDGMSDDDYRLGKNLYDAYVSENIANENYQQEISALERAKSLQEQQASIELDRLRKYLPTYLKQQGLGGLGVSATAYAQAENAAQNNLATLNAEYAAAKAEQGSSYSDRLQEIYGAASQTEASILDTISQREEQERAEAREEADITLTEMLLNVNNYTDSTQTTFTQEGYNKIKKYLDDNKDIYGEVLYNQKLQSINAKGVYTAEQQAADEHATALQRTKSERATNAVSTPSAIENGMFEVSTTKGDVWVYTSDTKGNSDNSKVQEAPVGQLFVKGDSLYVKTRDDKIYQVRKTTGSFNYKASVEDLIKLFRGTYYDLDV